MNKYIKARFTRVRNLLMKTHSKAVAHKLMKKQIESGMLPKEFLKLLNHKETVKEIGYRLKSNWKLKQNILRKFDHTCQDCGERGIGLGMGVTFKDKKYLILEESFLTVRCAKCRLR